MEIRKPNRVTRSFTQRLNAGPERVFPLLCPVREADWIEGWDPISVWSHSGLAEGDCVFTTRAPGHQDSVAVWFITRHDPEHGFVEMLKITPNVTACKLRIQVTATRAGSDAVVTYSHTSLGPEGDAFVETFTEAFYEGFMKDWESRMNHYLKTGAALRS